LYALPIVSLILFVIDQLTFNKTEMLFWVLFLLGMIPCGLLGFVLSLIGLIKSLKKQVLLNKVIGFVGIAGGFLAIIGGVLGFMLLYVVVGG